MGMEWIGSGFSGATAAAGGGGGGEGEFAVVGGAGEFGDEGGEEVRGGGAKRGELRFQRNYHSIQLPAPAHNHRRITVCQRGDKRSVLQSHRVKAFALAANVNTNKRRSISFHSANSAWLPPHK